MMLRYSDQVKRLSLVTVSPARSVTRISQSAYARAEPTKSQASKRRYPSYDLERSETFICQLVNASLTHFSTSLPTGYPIGVSATSEVISFMRCSSLLRCRCTNQVNLFSQPLYSLNSIVHPHFHKITHPNLPKAVHSAGTPKCLSPFLKDYGPHEVR